MSSPSTACADLLVACPSGGLRIGRAAHCWICGAAGDHHAKAAIGCSLDDSALGKQNDPLAVTGLNHGLRENALFPIAALHGHGRFCRFLDSVRALGERVGFFVRRSVGSLGESAGNERSA